MAGQQVCEVHYSVLSTGFWTSDHSPLRNSQAIFRDADGQLPSCIKRELAAGTLKVRLFNHSSACVLIKDLKANCIGTPKLTCYLCVQIFPIFDCDLDRQ